MFVCWCRCVIKVCEGWGPCSRGQIDCRHVNYRRQATCVTFFHLSAHTFPPFLRWLILPQHSFFFLLKTVWDSFCLSLSGSLFSRSWSVERTFCLHLSHWYGTFCISVCEWQIFFQFGCGGCALLCKELTESLSSELLVFFSLSQTQMQVGRDVILRNTPYRTFCCCSTRNMWHTHRLQLYNNHNTKTPKPESF